MPGRMTPPMPERLSPQWAMSALTSVPVAMAGGGMDDEAGRLVDDDEVVILVDDVERDGFALRLRRRRPGAGGRSHACPPSPCGRALGTGSPSTSTHAIGNKGLEARPADLGKARARASGRAVRPHRRARRSRRSSSGSWRRHDGSNQQPAARGKRTPPQPGLRFLETTVYIMGGLLVLMLVVLIGGIVGRCCAGHRRRLRRPRSVDIADTGRRHDRQHHARWRSPGGADVGRGCPRDRRHRHEKGAIDQPGPAQARAPQ